MRVLVVGRFHLESFASHIADSLTDLGHTAVSYEVGPTITGRLGLPTAVRRLGETVHELYSRTGTAARRKRADLLAAASVAAPELTIVCHDFLEPMQVASLRAATKAPVVLWFPDHVGLFRRAMFLNADYDALFFKDPYVVDALRRDTGLPIWYLPECFNPKHHGPVELTACDHVRYGCDIATAGNLHSNRIAVFRHLTDYDVKIWGHASSGWMNTEAIRPMMQRQFVANEEKSKAFRAAKIVLNNLQPGEIWGVNVRTFEACGAGAFQLVNARPGLANLFTDGQELVTFRDVVQLRERIDHYLARPEERWVIAEAGSARAHREHTYAHRLRLMMDTVAGVSTGYPMPEVG